MAQFNSPNQSQALPPSYTSSSGGRQYEADTSGSVRAKGFTQAFENLLKGVDQGVKYNIQQDVEAGSEQVNNEFGVGSATTLESNIQFPDGQGGGPGAVSQPTEVAAAARHLSSLQSSFDKGMVPERYYWARMNSMVRQLKAKYPGYSPEIDTMVQSTVGGNPANQLRNQLFREQSASANAKNKDQENYDTYVRQLSRDDKVGGLPKDFFQRQNSGQPYSMAELQKYASDRSSSNAEMTDRKNALQLEQEQGKVDHGTALKSFNADATSFTQRILQDSTTALGQSYKALQTQLNQAMRNPAAVTPDQKAALTAQFAQVKAQTRMMLQQHALAPWAPDNPKSGSYVQTLTKKEIDDGVETAMQPITIMEDAITNQKYGILGAASAWVEATKTAENRRLLQDIPWANTVSAMRSLWGDQTTSTFLGLVGATTQGAMAKTLMDYYHARFISTGQGSVGEDMTDAKKKAQDSTFFTGQIDKFQSMMKTVGDAKSGLPPENVAQMTGYYFGPKNYDLLNRMDSKSAHNYYSQMTSPQITQQMMKLRDAGYTDAWTQYQSWTVNAFANLSSEDFRNLAQYNLDRRQMQVVFNPQTSSFVLVQNPKYDPNSFRERMLRGEGVLPGGTMRGNPVTTMVGKFLDLNHANDALNSLNAGIRSIVPIIKANNGTVPVQLLKFFQSKGIPVEGIAGDVTGALGDAAKPLQTAGGDGKAPPEEPDILGGLEPFQARYREPGDTQGTTGQAGNLNILADTIGKGEGDYNSFNRGTVGSGGKTNLVGMTVGDILERQSLPRGDRNRLFAVGKYQTIPTTLKLAVQALNIPLTEKFTPELQDRIFSEYLTKIKRPEVAAYLQGKGSLKDAQLALAKEFASVADPRTGASFYAGQGGNRASIMPDVVGQALREERARMRMGMKIDEFDTLPPELQADHVIDMVDEGG